MIIFVFQCLEQECQNFILFRDDEDPTSSSGCCKLCGSDKWVIS